MRTATLVTSGRTYVIEAVRTERPIRAFEVAGFDSNESWKRTGSSDEANAIVRMEKLPEALFTCRLVKNGKPWGPTRFFYASEMIEVRS